MNGPHALHNVVIIIMPYFITHGQAMGTSCVQLYLAQ